MENQENKTTFEIITSPPFLIMTMAVLITIYGGIILVSAQNTTIKISSENNSIESCSLTNGTCIVENYTKELKTNCSEQLTILLNTFNDLVEDYKNGTNCGTIKELLVDNNKKLSDNLKECKADVDKNKMYMVGFYFLFAVMIILIIYFVYMSYGHKSQEEK